MSQSSLLSAGVTFLSGLAVSHLYLRASAHHRSAAFTIIAAVCWTETQELTTRRPISQRHTSLSIRNLTYKLVGENSSSLSLPPPISCLCFRQTELCVFTCCDRAKTSCRHQSTVCVLTFDLSSRPTDAHLWAQINWPWWGRWTHADWASSSSLCLSFLSWNNNPTSHPWLFRLHFNHNHF